MTAEKTSLFGDQATKEQVLQAPSRGAAKALRRQVGGFDEATWRQHRLPIVVRANPAKFTQNAKLRQYLQQTGNRILFEASPVDRVRGIGPAQEYEQVNNPNGWRGLDLLSYNGLPNLVLTRRGAPTRKLRRLLDDACLETVLPRRDLRANVAGSGLWAAERSAG